MNTIFENIYVQAFGLSFLGVCIIKFAFIKIIEGILTGMSITKSCKRKVVAEKYIYWIFPVGISALLGAIKPIEKEFLFNFIIYYGMILLIFNALFKTIISKIMDKIKKV